MDTRGSSGFSHRPWNIFERPQWLFMRVTLGLSRTTEEAYISTEDLIGERKQT